MFSPVAHFDEGHPRILVVNEIGLGLFKRRKRQGAGTGRKVENSIWHVPSPHLSVNDYSNVFWNHFYVFQLKYLLD
jgi:hypothetical protein